MSMWGNGVEQRYGYSSHPSYVGADGNRGGWQSARCNYLTMYWHNTYSAGRVTLGGVTRRVVGGVVINRYDKCVGFPLLLGLGCEQ